MVRNLILAATSALAFASQGCASNENYFNLVLLDSASPRLEALAKEAAADWEAKIPNLTICVTREHAYQAGRSHTMWFSEVSALPTGDLALTYHYEHDTGETGFLPAGISPTSVRHEMGHVMRLEHEAGGIMLPAEMPGMATTVQPVDVAQYHRIWG